MRFGDERGFSLLASVLAMFALALLAAVFMGAVAQHQYGAMNQVFSTQALYLAEAGFELAIQELMDGTDQAFNGAAPDGVVGGLANVPIGAGRVSVVNNLAVPPVLSSTGEVNGVKRTLQMTIDAKNLITQDWTFPTGADLGSSWPEFDKSQNNIGSAGLASPADNGPRFPGDGTTSFKARISGQNSTYFAYRQQAASVPANKRVTVRLNYKKNFSFGTGQPQSQELALLLWRSGDGSSQELWAHAAKSSASTWQSVDLRGILSGSPAFDRVRFRHDLAHNASAQSSEFTEAWLDNISISVVDKSTWKEL